MARREREKGVILKGVFYNSQLHPVCRVEPQTTSKAPCCYSIYYETEEQVFFNGEYNPAFVSFLKNLLINHITLELRRENANYKNLLRRLAKTQEELTRANKSVAQEIKKQSGLKGVELVAEIAKAQNVLTDGIKDLYHKSDTLFAELKSLATEIDQNNAELIKKETNKRLRRAHELVGQILPLALNTMFLLMQHIIVEYSSSTPPKASQIDKIGGISLPSIKDILGVPTAGNYSRKARRVKALSGLQPGQFAQLVNWQSGY